MEEWIVHYLLEHNMTMTTVESCTGGMIASRIVNVSGASRVFEEGYVTYSNHAKEKLVSVKAETIDKYNVVSREVAAEMAVGGAEASEADVAVSVTGVAGPEGGTDTIPVGTVCIGVYVKGKLKTERYLFTGDRMQVRISACDKALELVKKMLEECK